MKSRLSQYSHLPHIQRTSLNHNQKGKSLHERKSGFLSPKYKPRQSQIFKLLQQVRKNMISSLHNQQTIEKKTKKKQQNQKKRQSCLVKKQRKIYYMQTQPTNQNEPQSPRKLTNFVSNSVQIQQIESLEKPPHRTKMAMCIQGDKLYVYGGLGCEPNLRLAILDLRNKKWTFSQHQKFAQCIFCLMKDHPTTPLIGHTFGCYKGKGYIYGGSSNDVINQLTIVNFKTFKFTQGLHCQYRRKNHAMIMISKFMIIHGGIEANQITNTMYFYNTETNTWTYPTVSPTIPFLASHGMASTYPFQTKKKQISSLNQLQDPIFLFGGQDKSGNMCNSLFKVVFQNETFIATKIQITNGPKRRIQMCFQYLGNNTILLYGGKLDISEESESNQDDLSNQVYSFNTESQQWTNLSTLDILNNRYGMASTSSNGKVYIFGGFVGNKYTNANITTLTVWNHDLRKSKSNFGTRVFSCQKYC